MSKSLTEVEDIIEQCNQHITDASSLEKLQALVHELQTDEQKAEVGYLIGKHYHLTRHLDKALDSYTNAIRYTHYEKEDDLKAKIFSNIGTIHVDHGKFKEAKNYYLKALTHKEKLADIRNQANTFVNLGTVCVKLEEYIEAIEYYDKAIQLLKDDKNHRLLSHCLYNQGIIYNLNEDFHKALEYFVEALSSASLLEEKKLYISININIGEVYIEQKNFVAAEKYLKRSLELCSNENYEYGTINANVLVSKMYYHENKLDLAKKYAEDTIAIDKEIYFEPHALAHMYLGLVFLKKENDDQALKHLLKSYEIASKYHLSKTTRDLLPNLIEQYKKNKDYENAFKYLEQYDELRSAYISKKFDAKIADIKYKEEKERSETERIWHEQKNHELEKEKKRSDLLLKNILPEEVAEELKNTGAAKAILHEEVTVMFTDFHEFSKYSRALDAQELVAELHECFTAFDKIIARYDIEKIKTIGDAYLAASGLPNKNPAHAIEVAKAALEIRAFIQERKKRLGDKAFDVRIGIHSGPVVAGIVGTNKFAYDIWGDTVNTAARFEQTAQVGTISISETTYEKIKSEIACSYRGEIDAKNIGNIKAYHID